MLAAAAVSLHGCKPGFMPDNRPLCRQLQMYGWGVC